MIHQKYIFLKTKKKKQIDFFFFFGGGVTLPPRHPLKEALYRATPREFKWHLHVLSHSHSICGNLNFFYIEGIEKSYNNSFSVIYVKETALLADLWKIFSMVLVNLRIPTQATKIDRAHILWELYLAHRKEFWSLHCVVCIKIRNVTLHSELRLPELFCPKP